LLKSNQTSEERDVDIDVVTGDDGDDQRLVTFKNVEELQQRNAELLSLVREMDAERESAEFHLVNNF
jgi:hypothetical protein